MAGLSCTIAKLKEVVIFIHDEITKSLLVFDRAGKFILRIEAIGEGPKEFSELVSFTIDGDMQHIIIGSHSKLIAYDFSGNYQYEIKSILGGATQVIYTGDRKLAVFTDYIQIDESQGFNHVAIFDLDDKKIVAKAIKMKVLYSSL